MLKVTWVIKDRTGQKPGILTPGLVLYVLYASHYHPLSIHSFIQSLSPCSLLQVGSKVENALRVSGPG